MNDDINERLKSDVIEPLKSRFVGRDEVVDLIALAAVAGEHLFLFGPPGTAKSLLVNTFSNAVRCRYFEYLLTRFSEPNEIFGPVDLVRLREGTIATVTTGMLPEAEFAFLDELFNANSAILNNLLTVLNERVYRRGAETHQLPLISAFAASNHLPEDDTLQALYDRFLLRIKVDCLPQSELPALLAAGWAIEQSGSKSTRTDSVISATDLRAMSRRVREVDIHSITGPYSEAVKKIRDLGIAMSDRRAVKGLKLIAASAVLCNRLSANVSDFWVLRYVWDRTEQIGPLASLVAGLLDRVTVEAPHPRATQPEDVSAEQLAQEIATMTTNIEKGLKLTEISRLREQIQSVIDRAAWVQDTSSRGHLLTRANELLEKLG